MNKKHSSTPIREVDLSQVDINHFKHRYVGCIILTHKHQIILQQRDTDWKNFPGLISEFGGRIESHEAPHQTLARKLNEKLGAHIEVTDIIDLGAITEAVTNYAELIYTYFWHDKNNSITGCYAGKAIYYDNLISALNAPKIMSSTVWMLNKCQTLKLLK